MNPDDVTKKLLKAAQRSALIAETARKLAELAPQFEPRLSSKELAAGMLAACMGFAVQNMERDDVIQMLREMLEAVEKMP